MISYSENIKEICDADGAHLYIAATGAGAGIQDILWQTPGASSYLVGAEFPYSRDAMERFLGFAPDKFCSSETAMDMALESYRRCWQPGRKPIGIGLTASVATIAEHRGDHEVYGAWVSDTGHGCFRRVFEKASGLTARKSDGGQCDLFGVTLIMTALGENKFFLVRENKIPESGPVRYAVVAEIDIDPIRRIMAHPIFLANGNRVKDQAIADNERMILFPGAFNPFHFGHAGIMDAVQRQTGQSVRLDIEINPPHKDPLSAADMMRMRKQIPSTREMQFSESAPLYLDKARRNPRADFVIGVDALERMMDPRWGPNPQDMLEEFQRLGTGFHVAQRNGRTLYDLEESGIVMAWQLMFRPIIGNWDISSTDIRNESKAAE